MAAMAEGQSRQLQSIARKCARIGDQVNDDIPEVANASHVQYFGEADEWALIKPLNRARGRYTRKNFKPVQASQPPAFYIGIDTITFTPVFSAGPTYWHGTPSTPNYEDDFTSIQFKTKPFSRTSGRPLVLLDEYLFTPGALGFTKRLACGHAATVARIGEDLIREACEAQHAACQGGFPIDAFRDPDHDVNAPIRLAVCDGYLDGAYTLRLPRIRRAIVTKALFDLAVEIQAHFKRDNIHVNEIIVAIFVFFDHENHEWLRIEPRLLTQDNELKGRASDKVSPLHMLGFVLMFPHYLRMHELHRLVTYTHPYRYVEAMWKAKNTGKQASFHVQHNPEWFETAKSEVRLSGLTENDWACVLPSSLLGSRRRRPVDADAFVGPSAELHHDLALPDINMIGHPVYPISDLDTSSIIIPAPWLNPVIPRDEVDVMHRRTMTTTINVLGHPPVLAVHPAPEDITTREPRQEPVDNEELRDAMDAPTLNEMLPPGVSLRELISSLPWSIIKRDIANKIALAQAANLTWNDVIFDDDEILSFPGLANRPVNRPANHSASGQEDQPAPVAPAVTVISPKAKVLLEDVVLKYLKNKPHHASYDSLLRLDLAAAPEATVVAAVSSAIRQVQLLIDRISLVGESIHRNSFSANPRGDQVLFRGLSEDLFAPLLQLVGNEDMGSRQPANFDAAEVRAALSVDGVDAAIKHAARILTANLGEGIPALDAETTGSGEAIPMWDIKTNVLSSRTVNVVKEWVHRILTSTDPVKCHSEMVKIAELLRA